MGYTRVLTYAQMHVRVCVHNGALRHRCRTHKHAHVHFLVHILHTHIISDSPIADLKCIVSGFFSVYRWGHKGILWAMAHFQSFVCYKWTFDMRIVTCCWEKTLCDSEKYKNSPVGLLMWTQWSLLFFMLLSFTVERNVCVCVSLREREERDYTFHV